MSDYWSSDAEADGASPFDGSQVENVVPADGDPAVPYYRAQHQAARASGPRLRVYRFGGSPAGRRPWRRPLVALSLVVLALLLLIKPGVVLATILTALVVGVVVVGGLVLGVLWLALRFVLGAHATYPPTGGPRRGWWR